ncbi:MAG: helix-turn-helix domain-containing protein [Patescibacteria group bacterium]
MELDKKQLYTTEEVASILRVSAITVKRYIANQKIPSIKFSGIRRIKGADLAKVLNTTKKSYAK